MQKIAAGMIVAVALALTAVCATAEGDKKNAVASPKAAPRDQKGQRRKGAVTKKMTTPYRKIETTNSGLWNRFVDRVFSRSFAGLWSVIKLKMLHYNLCQAGTLC